MKGPWVWLAVWLAVVCASPMEMEYPDTDTPRSVYRNSGPRGYQFEYKVVDSHASWVHSRDEKSDGVSTRGSYAVKLPDGRIQRVTYTADDDGYHPVITYVSAEGGGDEGGGVKGYDWKGKSGVDLNHMLGVFAKMKDSLRIGYSPPKGLQEEMVTTPYYPHDLWDNLPHHRHHYDPLRLYDDYDDLPVYEPHHPYDFYYYDPPPPMPYDDHRHPYKYKTPIYLPHDSSEQLVNRNTKQEVDYKVESSEEHDTTHQNMKNYKPKSPSQVKMEGKKYLGDKTKRPMIKYEEESNETDKSYEMEASDEPSGENEQKTDKLDMYESSEESNEHMTERMDDEYESKEKMSDEIYSGESKEKKMDMSEEKKNGYKVIHSKSAQHKDMNEYIKKIKRVMATFNTDRSSYTPPSLYRQDTNRMVTPQKYIPSKKTSEESDEEESEEFKAKPKQMSVKMTPPDKPFHIPNHYHPASHPSPRPLRKHSLHKKTHTKPLDSTFHTSAPMLHAPPPRSHPPPPPPLRKHSLNKKPHTKHESAPPPQPPPPSHTSRRPIIRLMPPVHHPHHPPPPAYS
ncbi:uncharacterized protein LOC135089233 [Scylla paramamosain]|uniref:uncharacterized protein LOC135089233 n=1 Tax=Scylla paramamosain TaxID=85552 RepID=UPI003083297C